MKKNYSACPKSKTRYTTDYTTDNKIIIRLSVRTQDNSGISEVFSTYSQKQPNFLF